MLLFFLLLTFDFPSISVQVKALLEACHEGFIPLREDLPMTAIRWTQHLSEKSALLWVVSPASVISPLEQRPPLEPSASKDFHQGAATS